VETLVVPPPHVFGGELDLLQGCAKVREEPLNRLITEGVVEARAG
jgi:hypothetical protein